MVVKIRKKTIITLFILTTVPLATSVNLQMSIDTPDRVIYPNESVSPNISVENVDSRAAENANISVRIGERSFEYSPGTIEPGNSFERSLNLPEFPAGSYQAEMEAEYSGFLGEKFTETTSSGFKVQFPEFVKIPRQVYIENIETARNITSGESSGIQTIIQHDGDIEGDFKAAVISEDAEAEEEFDLTPGNKRELNIKPNFQNSGISFVETRLYAEAGDDWFLLDYLSDEIFVKEQSNADVQITSSTVENQGSSAEVTLELENNGSDAAYDMNISLAGEELELDSRSRSIGVLPAESSAESSFTVYNPTSSASTFSPAVQVSYRDGDGYHTVEKNVSMNLESGATSLVVDESEVETSEDQTELSLIIKNRGEADAENVKLELQSRAGITVNNPTAKMGNLESGESRRVEGLSFSVLKSAVDSLTLNIEARHKTDSVEETTDLSTVVEGGYSEGELCSQNWQCGTTQNSLSCNPASGSSNSRCCPPGQSYSSSAGTCLEKMTLVAVPIHYEDGSFQEFKEDTEEQVNFFAEKMPIRELENPLSRIEIKYLKPSEVRDVDTTKCGELNRHAKNVVLNSQYKNSFDKIAATTTRFERDGLLGCAYPYSNMEVTINSHPETMAHEMAHSFGLGHTQDHNFPPVASEPGCGADRQDREFLKDYLNDAESDGIGEIMNYCPGDNYFSNESDEYSSLKQVFQENGWMK